MQAGDDQPGNVGDVHHDVRSHDPRDLLELREVENPGIGAGADDDHPRAAFFGDLTDRVVINAFGGPIHAIKKRAIEDAGGAHPTAVGEMPAVSEIHTEDRIAGLEHGKIHGHVRLRAGVWLNVDVFRTKQLLRPFDRQVFDDIHVFAAAVVSPPRISLRVLVRHEGALRGKHGRAGEILGGDQQNFLPLPPAFPTDGLVHLDIRCPKRTRHTSQLSRTGAAAMGASGSTGASAFTTETFTSVVTCECSLMDTFTRPSSLMGCGTWILRLSTSMP